MKVYIPHVRAYWLLCLILFSSSQKLMSNEWEPGSSQEWKDSANWQEGTVPNGFLDEASILNGPPYPTIGLASNGEIDLARLEFYESDSQVTLGNGASVGTLNIHNQLNQWTTTGQNGGIILVNGVLNFQSNFVGNAGPVVAKCIFSTNGSFPDNQINFFATANTEGDIGIFEDSSSGDAVGKLNIHENVKLNQITLNSPHIEINIDTGNELAIDSSGGSSSSISVQIKGGGGLVKRGSDTLFLAGPSSYTGGTTIDAGTVRVVNDAALGSGLVSVASGGQLRVLSSTLPANALTLNGIGDGTGALFGDGAANNGYSGPITLGSNTTIGADPGGQGSAPFTLSNTNAITGPHNVTFTGAGDIVVSGIIATGTGTLTKNGSSTVTLSGANTYSGVTTVNSGSLTIQNDSALGSGSVSVANGAKLQLQGDIAVSNNLTLNGTGGGTGALVNVSGDNMCEGTITLNTEAIAIGSNANTLTLGGMNALGFQQFLTIMGAGDTNITGPLTLGKLTLTKNGSGTLTVSGTNTLRNEVLNVGRINLNSNEGLGTTALAMANSTILSLGSGVSVAKNITLTSGNATIDVSSGGTATLTNPIGGAGALTKTGSNTLVLAGSNNFSGGTTISAGRLSVNDQILGGVQVDSGATLGGIGTIYGGGTINGKLAPGNSIGTITFDTSAGDIVLGSSAVTDIEIDPTTASKIVITGSGNAVLGGSTINVIQNAGVYPASGQYTILQGPYTGLFNPTVTGGSLPFSLSYEPELVYLLFGSEPPPPSSLISTTGLFGNALVLANYLNANASSSTLALFDDLTDAQVSDAMKSISPSRNAFGPYIVAQTALSLSSMIAGHLDAFREQAHVSSSGSACAPAPLKDKKLDDTFTVWAAAFGEFARQKQDIQNPAFNFNAGGVLVGFDYKGENKSLVGGALGYGHTGFNECGNGGCGSVNYGSLSVYGNLFVENFYVAPSISLLFDGIDNRRNIAFSNFSAQANAHMSAWQMVPRVELGYDAAFSWGNVVPFTSVDAAITWQGGYQEYGATPFNASVGAKSSAMVRSETGLKAYETWEFDWGAFFLREKVSYVFATPCDIGIVNAAFIGTPGAFTVTAVNQNLNLCALGLDFLFAVGKERSVNIDVGYEGKFGPVYWSNQCVVTIGKNF